MTEIIGRKKQIGLKSQGHMINYAWLCKWVKSLPKMLPTAQISAFSLTCNNNNKNEPKILSFFPFGKARYCYYSVSIKTQEDLG